MNASYSSDIHPLVFKLRLDILHGSVTGHHGNSVGALEPFDRMEFAARVHVYWAFQHDGLAAKYRHGLVDFC